MLSIMSNTIGERLKQLIDFFGVSQNKFGESIGASSTLMSRWINGKHNPNMRAINKILELYPNVSSEWLLKGEGNMLDYKQNALGANNAITETNIKYITNYQNARFREFPYIAVKARASFIEHGADHSSFEHFETYPVFDADDKKYDKSIVIEVDGDSMEPNYHSGTKLLVSLVEKPNWPYITGVVAIAFKDFFVIKRIKKNFNGDGSLMLHSDNPQGADLQVEVKDIRSIWKVERVVFARPV